MPSATLRTYAACRQDLVACSDVLMHSLRVQDTERAGQDDEGFRPVNPGLGRPVDTRAGRA